MGSVRVVLPASMCAAIPMLRVLRRSIFVGVAILSPSEAQGRVGPPERLLPAVVGVGAVCLGHPLDVFLLLDCTTTTLRGIEQLTGDALDGGALGAGVRRGYEPAQRERLRTARPDLDRDLIGGTTDAAAAHLDAGAHVVESLAEDLQRLLAGALLDESAGTIEDAACQVLLAVTHDLVDEGGDGGVVVNEIRFKLPDFGPMSACHSSTSPTTSPASASWCRTWSGPGCAERSGPHPRPGRRERHGRCGNAHPAGPSHDRRE